MRIDILSPEQVLEYTGSFSLPKIYIERDALYRQNWLHLTADDYTNDAFVYIMPSETHSIRVAAISCVLRLLFIILCYFLEFDGKVTKSWEQNKRICLFLSRWNNFDNVKTAN